MKVTFDFKTFLSGFNNNYSIPYKSNDNIPHYKELVTLGEAYIKRYDIFVAFFNNYREDALTSDRELAALALTINYYLEQLKVKIS